MWQDRDMSGLHLSHLAALFLWGGVLAAEAVLEILPARHPELRPAAARFHFWTDLLIEVPLLAVIAGTGAALLVGRELDAALALKVGCGLVAVGANVVCVPIVVRRARETDAGRSAHWSRCIAWCAAVGVPFGLAALALGLRRFACPVS
jgi:hypothetical protein